MLDLPCQAILAGCSAGGLGVYLHCDAFAGLIHPQRASCLADAGYFANIPSAFANLSEVAPPIVNPRYGHLLYRSNRFSYHISVYMRCSQ